MFILVITNINTSEETETKFESYAKAEAAAYAVEQVNPNVIVEIFNAKGEKLF